MDNLIKAGRKICPRCLRKGVGYAPHPHLLGWKDFGRAVCRYCKHGFTIKDKPKIDEANDEKGA